MDCGDNGRHKSHRVSNVALISGVLLIIVCLALAVLGLALGLASLITQCNCDDNDDRIDRLEKMLSGLMDNTTITTQCGCDNNDDRIDRLEKELSGLIDNATIEELQQAVNELRLDFISINFHTTERSNIRIGGASDQRDCSLCDYC